MAILDTKVSVHAITLIRQSLDERSSPNLCYDRVMNVMVHRPFRKCFSTIKSFTQNKLFEYIDKLKKIEC